LKDSAIALHQQKLKTAVFPGANDVRRKDDRSFAWRGVAVGAYGRRRPKPNEADKRGRQE
jgi:hypothetical protein